MSSGSIWKEEKVGIAQEVINLIIIKYRWSFVHPNRYF
jgi:hypothetical protein